MPHKKHKRKAHHVLIVTSEATDAKVKQYRVAPGVMRVIFGVLCVIIGGLAGCLLYEEQIWEEANARIQTVRDENAQQLATIESLEEEKKVLEAKIQEQNDEIQLLSNTVNEKVQSESALAEQLESQKMPTEFPLTGSASMEEVTDGDVPMCVFKASQGITIVATASGTIRSVSDDAEYGHSVSIDHGNGYVTIYRNKGDAVVQEGDSIVQGSAIFIIGEDNTEMGYQIMKDGEYINPMDVLAING